MKPLSLENPSATPGCLFPLLGGNKQPPEALSPLARKIRLTIRLDPIGWASSCKINLRHYQREIALAIKDSVLNRLGLTFVVILPRQSGKNELQAHLFAWLLYRHVQVGGQIVSVSPTFKPQTINNMEKLKKSLSACIGTRGGWNSTKGCIYSFGNASVWFFSAAPGSNVVGATADLLLSVDEAQEVDPVKFDKDFDPMTASTNATRVFWGTAWTAGTLLERQRRSALQAQEQDGRRRVFFYTAEDVVKLVPAYAKHVERVIAEHGRNHPLVRTQYFCETIEAQGGMFNPARLALMFPSTSTPSPFAVLANGEGRGGAAGVAFLIDVAGMDESNTGLAASLLSEGLGNPGRDSTTLTVVEVDLSTLVQLHGPTYRVIDRYCWTGENHLAVFGKLKALAERYQPQQIVVDATGVGEGLWAMLENSFSTRVIPVKFSAQVKSETGWRFLSIIETGRFRDPAPSEQVRMQYSRCISEILPGPGRCLRWGVPDGTRGPDGELVHDDFILADALTACLDRLEWHASTSPTFIEGFDPLDRIIYQDPFPF